MSRVTLKISEPVDSGALAFDLRDILKAIAPKGNQFNWSVLHIQAMGVVENEDVPAFEKRVEESATGLRLSWLDLVRLAGGIEQTINCLIVGRREEHSWPDRNDHAAISASEVLIEAVDSSYWHVSTTDAGIAERLQHAFQTEDMGD